MIYSGSLRPAVTVVHNKIQYNYILARSYMIADSKRKVEYERSSNLYMCEV